MVNCDKAIPYFPSWSNEYTAGAYCGALLPTGNILGWLAGVEMTCVDNGMSVINMRASDFGLTGYETKAELDSNKSLK